MKLPCGCVRKVTLICFGGGGGGLAEARAVKQTAPAATLASTHDNSTFRSGAGKFIWANRRRAREDPNEELSLRDLGELEACWVGRNPARSVAVVYNFERQLEHTADLAAPT